MILFAGFAFAQSTPSLKLQLQQALVEKVQSDGKTTEHLTPASALVQPGALLEQTVAASNTTRSTLRGVVVNLPIPKNTVYTGHATASSSLWTTTFSADGGKTFGQAPLKERVTVTENGKKVTRDVLIPAARYTNARWTVTLLKPDETLKFALRVKVN